MRLEKGTTISHYKILSKIGKGGMGEVYLAEDTKLDRQVALKILPAEFAEDKDRMARFVREAKSASALNHPNIITIYEIGESDGTNYIATEFIDGKTLNEYAREISFDHKSSLSIAIQVASALDEAHQAGIVHRDIKPDNIMVRPNGLVKILDFGIAKVTAATESGEEAATAIMAQTQAGMIIGTPNYMSPEQARGKDIDHQTDIFSFGVVFYEMLSGSSPFAGETVSDVIAAVLTKEPKSLNAIPIELKEIVDRTLQKDKKKRYQTAKDLLDDLEETKQELEINSRLERTSSPNLEEPKTQILIAATDEESPAIVTSANENSIAVLPFTNMSADEDNEYFCDGLAEELLNALSKIEDLKVAARTSAFSFKGKNANVSEIGEKLSVKNVLEGSVRKSGDKLRISVRLENAAEGYQLWSESYDREMKDIFDIQDEIALAVVDALKVELFGNEKAAVLKRGTNNTEAYQLYLKGRYYFDKFTVEGVEKSVEFYKQALALEPNYADAFAALSKSYNFSWYVGFGETAKCISEAKAAVEKALALDESLAEAHHSLALIKFNYERDWPGAEKSFRRAIELNYAENHEHYSMFLAVLERSEEAIAEAKLTIELTPLALVPIYIAGWGFWFAGRPDLAKEHGEKLLEMEPNFFGGHTLLGMSLWSDGAYQKSIDKLETAVNLGAGNDVKMLLGLMYGVEGEREKANHLLTEFRQLDEQEIYSASQQAFICAGLGELDLAFDLLDKAAGRQEGNLVFLKQFSSLYPKFHNDPRMTDLLRRLGLPTDETKKTDKSREAQTVMLHSDTAEEAAAAEPTSEQTTDPKPKIQNSKPKWWLFGLLGLLVLVSGYFGYKYFSSTNQIESIAVMPFVNESGNEDVEYLSDGMTETLISSLSNLPNLNVKARSSVFRYKGKNTDAKTIGTELNVQAILNGRIVQRGDQLTLNLELVDTQTENVIWSDKYDRKMNNLVSLQSEIAKDVSTKLKSKLSGADEAKVTKTATVNPEAYQAYLKGRYYWNRRTAENIKKAIEQFKIAADKDPGYALAFAGLADCYALLNQYAGTPTSETLPQAKAFAEKALSIDSSLGETHATLGLINHSLWKWKDAEKEFTRAIELNRDYPTTYHWYSRVLLSLGRYDEALAMSKKAKEIDPLSTIISINVSDIYQVQNNQEASIENSLKTLELDPNFAYSNIILGLSYSKQGRNTEAIATLEKAAKLTDRTAMVLSSLGYVYATAGKRDEAIAVVEEIEEKYTKKGATEHDVAAVYAGLDEKDKAFEWLEKGFQARNGNLSYFRYSICFESLRDDPRFKDLLKRMNLPE